MSLQRSSELLFTCLVGSVVAPQCVVAAIDSRVHAIASVCEEPCGQKPLHSLLGLPALLWWSSLAGQACERARIKITPVSHRRLPRGRLCGRAVQSCAVIAAQLPVCRAVVSARCAFPCKAGLCQQLPSSPRLPRNNRAAQCLAKRVRGSGTAPPAVLRCHLDGRAGPCVWVVAGSEGGSIKVGRRHLLPGAPSVPHPFGALVSSVVQRPGNPAARRKVLSLRGSHVLGQNTLLCPFQCPF